MISRVSRPFFQSAQDCHQHPSSVGPGIGLRAKAHLASNHCGSEISLGKIVFRRYATVLSLVVHTGSIFSKDVLNTTDSKMLSWALYNRNNLRLQRLGFRIKLGV